MFSVLLLLTRFLLLSLIFDYLDLTLWLD